MRESRTSGFVRGAHSNMCPYRDPYPFPPSAAFNSSNLGMVSTEIQPTYQLPDRTCAVILIDQLLDVDGMQKELRTVNRC